MRARSRTLASVVMAGLALAGCAYTVAGRDNFKARAQYQTAAFSVPYQPLYQCFAERSKQGQAGYIMMPHAVAEARLYPDLKIGEYRHADDERYYALVEFDGREEGRTTVHAFHLRQPQLDVYWSRVTACADRLPKTTRAR